ncbi:di-trans,poly-cis-decaprenylcistransferase [Candidatus Daviesbacteria bacterium RIFOXYD1_FULL_41_10]|uniref:Di-trans,poly-cis-decaprenylcistransferase n=1 Tax=Candidatus Daviesbacteria bacterium RIFOXYD1_FULL_41_10 TaxID=1797801 RepID=A0A1F5N0R8_9BACT|nr:MAG: di-trans,poly-cis-decaprenylcistransferase [Candidatus Daviesbacteria bacterium RIFOXYD1_FULL_41_10]
MIASREAEKWLAEISDTWANIPIYSADSEKLRHLAVICDGNRRAARERNLPEFLGHRAGLEVIKGIACAGREWNINTLTFWVWSTENWERDKNQVGLVMKLANERLSKNEFKDELIQNEVRFKHLGRSDRLPAILCRRISELEHFTDSFSRFHLNLAMDYGGLDELARAVTKIKQSTADNRDPSMILDFLDTAGQPLPDLVIRTGVKDHEFPHTSGFMPLQTAYSSWIFTPDLFPNLTPEILLKSITGFSEYHRRFGK